MSDEYYITVKRTVRETLRVWADSVQDAEDKYHTGCEYDIEHEQNLKCEIEKVEPGFEESEDE